MTRSTLATAALLLATPVRAQPATDDTWHYDPLACTVVDGGLGVAAPSALPTGLMRGIGGGFTHGRGGFAWGARATLMTASEATRAWAITHRDARVRMVGALQHVSGRATLGIRAGIGGSLIRESRVRHQGMRAGLDGDELETTAYALVPVATLEAVIALRVRGAWSFLLSGGPAAVVEGGDARVGWTTELGIGWQR